MIDILAFESFDGGSHRQFRETITRHSKHSWVWVTRPPRAWKWRMAISAIELVDQAKEQGCFDSPPDLIFVTSLIDAAALRAALPRGFRDIPIVLYMHENQVSYPSRDARDASFACMNLQSILTSDYVIFNSHWNRDSFTSGIVKLLSHSPDHTLDDVDQRIHDRSTVAWVPVELPSADLRVLHNTACVGDSPIRIVWPHRWEHDKGPDELLSIARDHSESLNLRWIILGEQFREIPEAMKTFETEFVDRIDHVGFVESKTEYWKWLGKADWVLSTARHEFFGVAVVESLFAGCLPWLPDRLSYTELLPEVARGLTPMTAPQDSDSIRGAITEHLFMTVANNAVDRIDQILANCQVNP